MKSAPSGAPFIQTCAHGCMRLRLASEQGTTAREVGSCAGKGLLTTTAIAEQRGGMQHARLAGQLAALAQRQDVQQRGLAWVQELACSIFSIAISRAWQFCKKQICWMLCWMHTCARGPHKRNHLAWQRNAAGGMQDLLLLQGVFVQHLHTHAAHTRACEHRLCL